MGRYHPVECEHGRVFDWGDFGGEDDAPEHCPDCERDSLGTRYNERGRQLAEAISLLQRLTRLPAGRTDQDTGQMTLLVPKDSPWRAAQAEAVEFLRRLP